MDVAQVSKVSLFEGVLWFVFVFVFLLVRSCPLWPNVSRVTYLLDCSSLRVFSKWSHICHWLCLCHCIFWVRSCLPFVHMSQGSKVAEIAVWWFLSKLTGLELVRLLSCLGTAKNRHKSTRITFRPVFFKRSLNLCIKVSSYTYYIKL